MRSLAREPPRLPTDRGDRVRRFRSRHAGRAAAPPRPGYTPAFGSLTRMPPSASGPIGWRVGGKPFSSMSFITRGQGAPTVRGAPHRIPADGCRRFLAILVAIEFARPRGGFPSAACGGVQEPKRHKTPVRCRQPCLCGGSHVCGETRKALGSLLTRQVLRKTRLHNLSGSTAIHLHCPWRLPSRGEPVSREPGPAPEGSRQKSHRHIVCPLGAAAMARQRQQRLSIGSSSQTWRRKLQAQDVRKPATLAKVPPEGVDQQACAFSRDASCKTLWEGLSGG